MRRISLRFLIPAILAAGASVIPAYAIVVRTAPPPLPRSAAVAAVRPPRRGMVWAPGYYSWRAGRYRWMPGRWVVPPRSGARWVSPRWRRSRGGYQFVAGYWR